MKLESGMDSPGDCLQDGKHLVFILDGYNYGIQILDVSEIIEIMDITPIPKSPSYIKGIINLRGKVMPVLDLRLKLGMPPKDYDEKTCIIIVNLLFKDTNKPMGILVDTVSEVFSIPLSEIEAPPSYGEEDGSNYLSGVGKVKDKLVMLLNIKKILDSKEIIKILTDKNYTQAGE